MKYERRQRGNPRVSASSAVPFFLPCVAAAGCDVVHPFVDIPLIAYGRVGSHCMRLRLAAKRDGTIRQHITTFTLSIKCLEFVLQSQASSTSISSNSSKAWPLCQRRNLSGSSKTTWLCRANTQKNSAFLPWVSRRNGRGDRTRDRRRRRP